nr:MULTISPECIES: hypothetical protein [Agrobacterium]
MSGWKENIPFDVDGRTCAAITFARKGETLFDRAWIDGNRLRFPPSPSNGRTARRMTGRNPRLKPSITEHPIRRIRAATPILRQQRNSLTNPSCNLTDCSLFAALFPH